MPSTASATGLPFDEAVNYFRQKTSIPSSHWTTLMDEANARGFAVAGVTSKDMLADFRAAVEKGIAKGTTLQEFRGDFDAIQKKYGWNHTGTAEWRARIIYQTNLSNAFSAGRYAQAMDPDVLAAFPYWEYLHVNCPNPRLMHLAWSGTVLRADDPWWATHYPPNGWGCHCIVCSLGARDLARRRIDPMGLKAPPVQWREYVNRTTGVVTQHPAGIDPSFAYNPGKAWLDGTHLPARAQSLRPIGAEPPVLARPGQNAVQPGVMRKFMADPRGAVQVGRMGGAAEAHLGTPQSPVLLSAETLAKQAAQHKDIAARDYDALEGLIGQPAVTLAEDVRHVRLIGQDGDRLVTAVLKRTGQGDEVYVQSFHTVRLKSLRQMLKRDKLLHGDAAGLLAWMEQRDGAEKKDAAAGPAGTPQ